MSVDVVTFGCRLNACESEVMRGHARAGGIENAVVVNTCAVTAEAVRQARQAIRRVKRERPHAPVVVTGCAAQIEPAAFTAMPEVALILGNAEKMSPAVWREQSQWLACASSVEGHERKILVNDIMAVTQLSSPSPERGGIKRARAFVQVQTGCDHRCTFCVIPYGRGNSRSVPLEQVVAQVQALTAAGYREIVLTGVDLTDYGGNLAGRPRLGTLVKCILREVPALARLRLSSIDAVEADADVLDAFATEPRLMPHLHLSLQAGDDLILKRMKRRHRRADAIRFCAQLRRLRPAIAFGADIIAGFPTETDAMFARSLDLVEECGLTHLHVFPFSARPGTPAARMPQLPAAVIKDRARSLRQAGEAALRRHLDGEVGRRHRILSEGPHAGRTEQFTSVRLAAPVAPGTIGEVEITGHDGRQLLAA